MECWSNDCCGTVFFFVGLVVVVVRLGWIIWGILSFVKGYCFHILLGGGSCLKGMMTLCLFCCSD